MPYTFSFISSASYVEVRNCSSLGCCVSVATTSFSTIPLTGTPENKHKCRVILFYCNMIHPEPTNPMICNKCINILAMYQKTPRIMLLKYPFNIGLTSCNAQSTEYLATLVLYFKIESLRKL